MALTEIAGKLVAEKLQKPVLREVVATAASSSEKTVAETLGRDTLKTTASKGGMVNHAVFFDTNFDRKISLRETREGLQHLNFGQKISYLLAVVANVVLGEGSRAPAGSSFGYRLKNLFTVDLDNLIKSAEHESGGIALDPIKRVDSQMKFDAGGKGSVTLAEIGQWLEAEHPGGKNGRTKAGFGQLFQVAADTTKTVTENGVEKQVPAMSRTALEHFYQGSLFYDIAARNGHPHPLPPGQ